MTKFANNITGFSLVLNINLTYITDVSVNDAPLDVHIFKIPICFLKLLNA